MSIKKIVCIVLIVLVGLSVVVVLSTPVGESGAYKLVSSKADNLESLINVKNPMNNDSSLKTVADFNIKKQNDPVFRDAMDKWYNTDKAYDSELTLINNDNITYGVTYLINKVHKDKTLSNNDKIALYMQISSVIDDYSNKFNSL
jgi:hypothetical protein